MQRLEQESLLQVVNAEVSVPLRFLESVGLGDEIRRRYQPLREPDELLPEERAALTNTEKQREGLAMRADGVTKSRVLWRGVAAFLRFFAGLCTIFALIVTATEAWIQARTIYAGRE